MKAMILAAGLGTRLQPYTQDIPKPLFQLAGRPLLDIAIENLIRAGCEAVIINTHHLHEQIEAFTAEQSYSIPVDTCYEPIILGTGGAIKNVENFWDNRPFMVVNGDVYSTIDLNQVYSFHSRHNHPASLVLYDEPTINTVSIDKNNYVADFGGHIEPTAVFAGSKLTFTGIQVLDSEILNYIPANVFSSSIDAFKKMMADGKKIQGYIPRGAFWNDIGTPQRFQQAAIESNLAGAFRRAHSRVPAQPTVQKKLKGDGSQRHWYRLNSNHLTLIMVDHGIHTNETTAEIDAFINIGNHLRNVGIPVPEIYGHDRFAGLVFLEDLGDTHLQSVVHRTTDERKVMAWYKKVIDILLNLSISGAKGFDPAWTCQTPSYDQRLILDKECRYFVEAFLNGYLGKQICYDAYRDEFISLAHKALEDPQIGFMHRDLQARNIMLKNDRIYLIDFQGGRLGPLQYDLASLLIDPYVELPVRAQSRLLDYCIDKLAQRTSIDTYKFRRCYRYCCLARNLQVLGAFGFLSKARQKRYFERYIPAALKSLTTNLTACTGAEFPKLKGLVLKLGGAK
jgi:aminoglycoside/choline kinase family phosphotransferase/GTP:adenosylcobinamide-phosphate guanylyltransferase